MSDKPEKITQLQKKLAPVFEKVGSLTIVQRILICVLVFAAVGGSWYYFFYMPRNETLTKLEKTLQTKEQQLAKYKREASELLAYEKKMAAAKVRFEIAMRALPDKRELPSLLTGVSKSGSDAGLSFLLFKPETEIEKSFYKEIPISIKLEGRYHQMTDFFFQVVRLNRIVNINNVTVNSRPNSSLLEMTCRAVTYMFLENKEQDNNKTKKRRKK